MKKKHCLFKQVMLFRGENIHVTQPVSSDKIREGLQLGIDMVKEVVTLSSIYTALLLT